MYVFWRREEALSDVQLNEYLHFASESGMIEYLNLRTYHGVEPAAALALTRQIPQGGHLALQVSPLHADQQQCAAGGSPLTDAQLALQRALSTASPTIA